MILMLKLLIYGRHVADTLNRVLKYVPWVNVVHAVGRLSHLLGLLDQVDSINLT